MNPKLPTHDQIYLWTAQALDPLGTTRERAVRYLVHAIYALMAEVGDLKFKLETYYPKGRKP